MSFLYTLWEKDLDPVIRKDSIGQDQVIYAEHFPQNQNLHFISDNQVSPIAVSFDDAQDYQKKDVYSWSEQVIILIIKSREFFLIIFLFKN